MTSRTPLWSVARQMHRAQPAAAHLPPLWFVTDQMRVPDPETVTKRLPAGAGIIVRDYDAPDRSGLARELTLLARDRGLAVLIAGDAALATAVQADGVHLPEYLMKSARRLREDNPDWLITVAAHSRQALVKARRLDVDAALLSPVFATQSHPGATPLGPVRFAALVQSAALPVYALGGVTKTNARRLLGTGAAGIAAIGGI